MSDQLGWTSFDSFLTAQGDELPLQDSERFVSFTLSELWPSWQREGRCYGVGSNYFFGDEQQQPTMSIKQVRRAAKLCDVCPVFRECLTWALENNEEYGVWAGTSGRTRRKIQKVLDAGSVTIPEVVEDFAHGRGSKYSGPQPRAGASNPRHRSQEQCRSSLRVEATG